MARTVNPTRSGRYVWPGLLAAALALSGAAWLVRGSGSEAGAADPSIVAPGAVDSSQGWPAYGGDAGGARYSSLTQIDRENVGDLQIAWTHRHGDVADGSRTASVSKFEATPIFIDGTLYLATPFDRVIALEAETGQRRWSYDPKIDLSVHYSEDLTSRGVSFWADPEAEAGAPCARRIFAATIDARLIALDAATGRPCPGFGNGGQVDLKQQVGEVERGEYEVTSPPAIIEGLVIVGSAIGDNRRVDVERGIVRAFDARSGALRWSWDPIPRSPEHPAWRHWTAEGAARTGAANAWSIISADPERGLVFVPTGSAAPDYYGGERPGRNDFANSIVALRAATGEVVWSFQVVHHDLWDYDVAAQPALVEVVRDGQPVPAVVAATKMGHLFVLHRETGAPLFPVEERAVPSSDVPGEEAWPTQPFPVLPPPLHPRRLSADQAFGLTDEERASCRERIRGLRSQGIFTPPSLQGTLLFPAGIGGINWGGVAFDRGAGLLVTIVNRLPGFVRLIPREEFAEARRAAPRGVQFTGQEGTPYGMSRAMLLSARRVPCAPPPWGTLVAVDLGTGEVRWEVPLGYVPYLAADVPESRDWGSIAFGGPIVTAGGLVFAAAGMDDHIRAFDVATGETLWEHDLPAGGQATPMTFLSQENGKQYVVIAAGGHAGLRTTLGDYVVAFALP